MSFTTASFNFYVFIWLPLSKRFSLQILNEFLFAKKSLFFYYLLLLHVTQNFLLLKQKFFFWCESLQIEKLIKVAPVKNKTFKKLFSWISQKTIRVFLFSKKEAFIKIILYRFCNTCSEWTMESVQALLFWCSEKRYVQSQ